MFFTNLKKIRRDFPILSSGLIYLDSAASSLTPEPVLDKMLEFYRTYRANIERGVYQLAQKAGEEYETARQKIAGFVKAKRDEIVISKNSTEGINTIASGLKWRKGDKIVTTNIEHHSNFIVWLRIKERYGVKLEIINSSKEGILDLGDFDKIIDDRTKIVAVTQVSNVLGTITPVDEIARIAHKHGALVLIDGAQSVPHIPVDIRKIDCDFLVFSGHKMCGPTGIGILYIRRELLNKVEPLCIGGGTIKDVGIDYYSLKEGPERFEAGTPPIAEAIGLGAAVDYLNGIGMDRVMEHDLKLVKKMQDEIMRIPRLSIYGPDSKQRVGIISFNVEGLSPHDVALALDATANIMVRSGAHCALPLMKDVICQPNGTVRASTYIYNTSEEIEKFLKVLSELSSLT